MDLLHHIFAFEPNSPLLFTQFYFWAFFAVVYMLFAVIAPMRKEQTNRIHIRNAYLFLVSLFFYYKTSGLFLLILLFVTCSDYCIALQIHRNRTASYARGLSAATRAKLWLTLSVLVDLSLLCYFKYAYFFTNLINDVLGTDLAVFDLFAYVGNGFSETGRFMVDRIVLPVGISFYIFQVISYTVDVYRGHVQPVRKPLDFGFYVSFFPQLVAGPIVRASEFIPQLYKPFHLSRRWFGMAVFWILNGLAKKIILSDYLAVNFIDRVFENPLLFSGFENLMALFTYSLQVYADFSGYTDIAIGVAMLMGFYLPKNFDSPYKSLNPQEFWRRWHMSLSRWLKSYVYIPLGGNRTWCLPGKPSRLIASNFNSFLTMLIGGLWHGASWNFVIWGGLNGIGMIVNKCWRSLKEKLGVTEWIEARPVLNKMDNVLSILLTFVFISFTRLFFRASSNLDPATANHEAWETAKNMVHQIFGTWETDIIPLICWEYKEVFALFLFGMLIHWLPEQSKRWYRICFAKMPLPLMAIFVVITVFILYQFITADLQAFIYFQF